MRRITHLLYAAVVASLLPLFPLNTPLVPGLILPLHIFEPRYRALVEDLLTRPEDEREFGIIAVREGCDVSRQGIAALYPIGTATVLRQADRLDDGRYDIVTTGSRRFRLMDLDASRPLLVGAVDFLDDISDPADRLLADEVARRFRGYRLALSGQVAEGGAGPTVDGRSGDMRPPDARESDDLDLPTDDDSAADAQLPDDPTVLSYLVTAAMVLPMEERQRLLSAASTAERLLLARGLLSRETGLITALSAVPALDLLGYAPSVN